jgi:hypothetical protein
VESSVIPLSYDGTNIPEKSKKRSGEGNANSALSVLPILPVMSISNVNSMNSTLGGGGSGSSISLTASDPNEDQGYRIASAASVAVMQRQPRTISTVESANRVFITIPPLPCYCPSSINVELT